MIQKFFECYLPITCCNLKCDYCYVPQFGWQQGQVKRFRYSIPVMRRSLSQRRLGGRCYFSICGGGETLMHPDLFPFVKMLLEEGHYVNLTNNGTYTRGIENLANELTGSQRERLHFAFSLHWDELTRLGLLEAFAQNVKRVKEAGCSFVVQINMCDSYARQFEKIKAFSMSNFGALPQVAVTRKDNRSQIQEGGGISLYSDMTNEEYTACGRLYGSPLFEFALKNFTQKQTKFCYAGVWSYCLELSEGILRPCYSNGSSFRIFDSEKPLPRHPVGCHCKEPFCVNGSHFLALGVVPELYRKMTYAGLRDRPEAGWYNPCMADVLSHKLSDANGEFGWLAKKMVDLRWFAGRIVNKARYLKRKWL